MLVMELFAVAIRRDVGVSGIQVGTTEHKIGLYVDDMLLILSDPLCSVSAVSCIIQEFGNQSSLAARGSQSEHGLIGLVVNMWYKRAASYLQYVANDSIRLFCLMN